MGIQVSVKRHRGRAKRGRHVPSQPGPRTGCRARRPGSTRPAAGPPPPLPRPAGPSPPPAPHCPRRHHPPTPASRPVISERTVTPTLTLRSYGPLTSPPHHHLRTRRDRRPYFSSGRARDSRRRRRLPGPADPEARTGRGLPRAGRGRKGGGGNGRGGGDERGALRVAGAAGGVEGRDHQLRPQRRRLALLPLQPLLPPARDPSHIRVISGPPNLLRVGPDGSVSLRAAPSGMRRGVT